MSDLLPLVRPQDLRPWSGAAVDAGTVEPARAIVDDVRRHGHDALRAYAERLDDLGPAEPLVLDRSALRAALDRLDRDTRALLERTAERIRRFATAQRQALEAVTVPVAGGTAGHHVRPVARAGCYAPGGRYPLPSSVLMTAVTARAAGVDQVWVASPRPPAVMLAAAAIAGADAFLAAGGAQAVAALAYGAGRVPACDIVVGPGNRWVTAAKHLVAGDVRIDMLAGPSELVVLADDTASPEVVAADLVSQAEHDPDARVALVSPAETLVGAVRAALPGLLDGLHSAEVARVSLLHGAAVPVADLDEGIAVCDRLAPEHLEIMTRDARAVAGRCRYYGALFVGAPTSQVLGDYGAGPNHVLPTGGTARGTGGLSVLDFLCVRSWLELDEVDEALFRDAVELARLEGLEGHARAAEARLRRN